MKVTVTNKADASMKAVYENVINLSVQTYQDEVMNGKPHYVLELPGSFRTATFNCKEWSIEVE